MSIEDVQYLVNNSVEDSATIFVDSGVRNKEFYPTPAEYVVDFPDPLKNVFNIQILDGTIPSSMYNVDINNNLLRVLVFKTLEPPYVPPFEARQLLNEIGDSPRHQNYFDNTVPTRVLVVQDQAYRFAIENGFVPDDGTQNTVVDLESKFAILARSVANGVRLEKNVRSRRSDPGYAVFVFQGDEYAVNRTTATANINAVPLIQSLDTDRPRFFGSEYVVRERSNNGSLYDVSWFDIIETTESSLTTYIQNGHSFVFDVSCHDLRLVPANYTIDSLETQFKRMLKPLQISISSDSDTVSVQFTHRFKYKCPHRFFFDMKNSSARSVMGFSEYATSIKAEEYDFQANLLNNDFSVKYGSNLQVFGSLLSSPASSSNAAVYEIRTPGIINLLGVRYVKLRCPEFEDYMNGRVGYTKYSPGLGIFKLGGRNEVNHIRFDFQTVKTKNIHPIGKLSRLTFRFERPDGELYDFKGIDHHLYINIKMWVPTQKMEFKGSVLNEEYNPDIRAYTNNQFVDPDEYNDGDDASDFLDDLGHDDKKVNDLPYDYPTDESEYSEDFEDSILMRNFEQARMDADASMRHS
jgi:hypothetical protein